MAKNKKVEITKKVPNTNIHVDEEKSNKEERPEYHLVVKLNDQVFEIDTNDIAGAIKIYEPEFLRTKLIIQVTKDGKTLDRMFFLNDGKRLFTDKIKMEMFIKNLIF